MKKLKYFLLSLFLLILSDTNIKATALENYSIVIEDTEVQSLINSLKEIRKQERKLLDEIVSKRHFIRINLEGKDEKTKKNIENYEHQFNLTNQSLKLIKEKKIESWKELKIARHNNDISKIKYELKNLINLEKQTIEKIKIKLSILDSIITSLKNR